MKLIAVVCAVLGVGGFFQLSSPTDCATCCGREIVEKLRYFEGVRTLLSQRNLMDSTITHQLTTSATEDLVSVSHFC